MLTLKRCTRCEVLKTPDQFATLAANKYNDVRKRKYCLDCDPSYENGVKLTRAEMLRRNNRRRKFGVTHEEYLAEVEKRGSRCDLCDQVAVLRNDHDHQSGDNRGYLCDNCNLGLGHFKDNVETLKKAIAYLDGVKGE